MSKPAIAHLVCGSPYRNHDFDFARLRLAQALYDAEDIRVDCFQDYENAMQLAPGNLLISYTSRVAVSDAACTALRTFVEGGGRWFALHASNSVLDNPHLPQLLGSRFLSHPPYQRLRVQVTRPADPLLAGIEDFEVDDEPYCIENCTHDLEVLLHTKGAEADRPLMYRRRVGAGGILYLALGHANRPYDKPFADRPDQPEQRGPWHTPAFSELIKRGVEWAAKRRPL